MSSHGAGPNVLDVGGLRPLGSTGMDTMTPGRNPYVHAPTTFEPREKCGLFGVYGANNAAELTYVGLFALQHRGQESAGIVTTDGDAFKTHRGMGLVGDVFESSALARLSGSAAIGHVRYSTTGSSILVNAQPFVSEHSREKVAVALNGNLTNAHVLRRRYESGGSIFQTTTDAELLVHLLARRKTADWSDFLAECLRRLQGAFCFLILTPEQMVAVRDRNGFRPLWLGRLGETFVVASETCALDAVGAERVREIECGEMAIINSEGLSCRRFVPAEDCRPTHCIFEHIYFARPDSYIFGDSVYEVRKELGRSLWAEHPVAADAVVPVPDGAVSAACGFSQASGIPMERGLIRSHYVGRTFIEPARQERSRLVALKFNVVREAVAGRRLVIVEDSIVRGTTSRGKIAAFRTAGAKEVHMRISCPPHQFPCHYGIDFPTSEELLAAQMDVEEIRQYLQLDSLGYLSEQNMLAAVSRPADHYCAACFTGRYPVPLPQGVGKFSLER